jgi:hypothetical protein
MLQHAYAERAQTIEEIQRCREAVKAKLARRQAQVADLNEVQALLAKLEAVFQLPARLRVAIDAKAYALWTATSGRAPC